jgi:inositol transport system ATP-binding protein
MKNEFVLQMKGITKRFPGITALDDVNLQIRRGSVHALVGENGAGKSTLMKCLIGLYKPDEGSIEFKDVPLEFNNIHTTLRRGISMIHQEITSVPDMTVAQNIFLGKEILQKGPLVNDRMMNSETRILLERLQINIVPDVNMRTLSTANTQLVEIAKALSYGSDLIIMDEPTSALTSNEVKHLFQIIRSLQNEGRSIIYITHKMEEIFEVCDEATVLRDGKRIGNGKITDLNKDKLIAMMVGRDMDDYYVKENNTTGKVLLEVKDLAIGGLFHGINFKLHEGEILGFSGLLGSRRTEIVETIFGLRKATSGEIHFMGKPVLNYTVEEAIKMGMGLVTEDRKLTGLFPPLSILDNMSMAGLYKYTKAGKVNDEELSKEIQIQIDNINIKTTGLNQIIINLSGGNQQKVLISRWLMLKPKLMLLDEPTRGIDVGAKAEIYKLMNQLTKQGTAIIMVSSEMPELLRMSDNILVMHEGHQRGILPCSDATQISLLTLAIGEKMEIK